MIRKGIALIVTLLFIGVNIVPSSGNITEKYCSINYSIKYINFVKNSNRDGVNVTIKGTIGDNDWFISWVFIIIEFGPDVQSFWCRINDGDWIEFLHQMIIWIHSDGEYNFCYYYIDNGEINQISSA